MEKVKCLTRSGQYEWETAYNVNDFPYHKLAAKQINNSKYIEKPITFDIETSTILDVERTTEKKQCWLGFMYHWQLCAEGYVCFGRKWQELIAFIGKLTSIYSLNDDRKLVCYVHNLSYEFQFLLNYFTIDNIFATDSHKVLRCTLGKYIELRCSYYLSNKSLAKAIEENPNRIHLKGVDDLDYRKVRTWKTRLTFKEKGYNYNDVLGLYEYIMFKLEHDTLDSIPMTSTGYVRRHCRNAMKKNPKNHERFIKIQLTDDEYQLCRECFRGGNTASSRYLCDMILYNVGSYDYSSSYPAWMVTQKFPYGKFIKYKLHSIDELEKLNSKHCTIGRYIFTDIQVKKNVPIPYIPVSKCLHIKKDKDDNDKVIQPLIYNGRLLKAKEICIALTNIDYDIIKNQYDYKELRVFDFEYAYSNYLPKEFTDCVYEFFENKSKLKGVVGKEYEYGKSKNMLNALYGMIVTAIKHEEWEMDADYEWHKSGKETTLKKYYSSRNNFLSYQWGIFVTAYARKFLQMGIDCVGMDCVYVDTDSVKYINDHDADFEKLNNKIRNDFVNSGRKYYVEINDRRYEMGTMDKETTCLQFKTMGAKKYAYVKPGDKGKPVLGITVSGVSKKAAKDLVAVGGLDHGLEHFKKGFEFKNSGRTTAYYNNEKAIRYFMVEGVPCETGSNIALVEGGYTLGITDSMESIINTCQMLIDDLK